MLALVWNYSIYLQSLYTFTFLSIYLMDVKEKFFPWLTKYFRNQKNVCDVKFQFNETLFLNIQIFSILILFSLAHFKICWEWTKPIVFFFPIRVSTRFYGIYADFICHTFCTACIPIYFKILLHAYVMIFDELKLAQLFYILLDGSF